jgi:hypothetical protein
MLTKNIQTVVIVFVFRIFRGCNGRDRIVVGFTTTFAIGAYHH